MYRARLHPVNYLPYLNVRLQTVFFKNILIIPLTRPSLRMILPRVRLHHDKRLKRGLYPGSGRDILWGYTLRHANHARQYRVLNSLALVIVGNVRWEFYEVPGAKFQDRVAPGCMAPRFIFRIFKFSCDGTVAPC